MAAKPPSGPPAAILLLEEELMRLPGVGKVTARRLAYHLLAVPEEEAGHLAEAILRARRETRRCGRCGNLGATDPCWVCTDPERLQGQVCIVEDPRDLLALERARVFRGLYHVLPARLSPLQGIGPAALGVEALKQRLLAEGVQEVVLATNPDQEGEATARHLASALAGTGVKVSRIARGIPAGSAIEQAQPTILMDAFEGRRPMGEEKRGGAARNEAPADPGAADAPLGTGGEGLR